MARGTTAPVPGIEKAAVLGAGVIGASWAALFAARGVPVTVHDPAPGALDRVLAYAEAALPVLRQLGIFDGELAAISATPDAGSAVEGAGFVQESVPERLAVKHALYGEIEEALAPGGVVASSASGLTLSQMQAGWRDPARFVLGHPFNPPHLIPLVEVMGNERTDPAAVERAEAVYGALGKVTIRVRREVPGHVANRLQAALWREAIHLVAEGVASVEDVDKAVWAGPGLRWAAMGPTQLFHLGAGPGGLAEFCSRYRESFHRWWADLGDPQLDPETVDRLVAGLAGARTGADTGAGTGTATGAAARETAKLGAQRDALIAAMLAAAAPLRR